MFIEATLEFVRHNIHPAGNSKTLSKRTASVAASNLVFPVPGYPIHRTILIVENAQRRWRILRSLSWFTMVARIKGACFLFLSLLALIILPTLGFCLYIRYCHLMKLLIRWRRRADTFEQWLVHLCSSLSPRLGIPKTEAQNWLPPSISLELHNWNFPAIKCSVSWACLSSPRKIVNVLMALGSSFASRTNTTVLPATPLTHASCMISLVSVTIKQVSLTKWVAQTDWDTWYRWQSGPTSLRSSVVIGKSFIVYPFTSRVWISPCSSIHFIRQRGNAFQ